MNGSHDEDSEALTPSDFSCASEDLDGEIEDVEVNKLTDLNKLEENQKQRLLESLEAEPVVVVDTKRRRKQVDYKALNKELFGELESPEIKTRAVGSESDEDGIWSPTKKRKTRAK